MIISGGLYQEICEFPYDNRLYGPGLRSAAAIRNISSEPTQLHTFIGSNTERQAEMKAAAYDFGLKTTTIPKTVTYRYLHNHSHPVRSPKLDNTDRELGLIEGDSILRFGYVEGTAVVKGERVVYDPQSEEEEPFHENGSQADELAIVLNRSEAQAFTGKASLPEMLNALTTGKPSADVAVIKCGPAGAVVRVQNETFEIPVYETEKVWNIGSGDVFSSIFSVYWAEYELHADEAARKASLGTAYYCSTRDLPIPRNPKEEKRFQPTERGPTLGREAPTIYLASPFFDIGEFWLMDEVHRILSEEGLNVIAPYYDIGRKEEYDNPKEMAEDDLKAIEEADGVLALIDNCDPGTTFELGYARKLGKPVVAYQHEPEQSETTMLEGAGCSVYGDLSTAIFKIIWRLK